METPETISTSLQAGEWSPPEISEMHTSTYRYTFQKVHAFSCPGSILLVQGTTTWSVHTHRVHGSGKGGQVSCTAKGYKDPLLPGGRLEEGNVLEGQPLHLQNVQIFTDTSKEVWGAHLNKHTARGALSLLESKLHINYLALKEFQDFFVAYINKEEGMKSGPFCALIWRILTWCSRKQVTLKG